MTPSPSLRVSELELEAETGPLSLAVIAPPSPRGMVIVARGNGNAPPSHQVSFPMFLLSAGLAVAACDLLTPRERQAAHEKHLTARNVRLLRDRLIRVVDLVRQQADGTPLGLVAAGTLAAAALDAASLRPLDLDAVVCRNGRLDHASLIANVQTPTLIVIASDNPALIRINDDAFRRLTCPKHCDVIPAGHTEAEDARVWRLSAELARNWLLTYLRLPTAA